MSRCQITPGFRVGRLVVLERLPNVGKRSLWRCQCDCGKQHTVYGERLSHPSHPTQSCGCRRVEATITNLHRARAARNAQLSKQRAARLEAIAEAKRQKRAMTAAERREDFRQRAAREEQARHAASLDLARCLGYPGGE